MNPPPRKITFSFRYKEPQTDSLKVLSSRITSIKDNKFRVTYGNILDLLFEKIDFGELTTLAQYYDIPLRCFTFPDFQLSPTLEEFERILNQSTKDYNPFPKLEEGFTLFELEFNFGYQCE